MLCSSLLLWLFASSNLLAVEKSWVGEKIVSKREYPRETILTGSNTKNIHKDAFTVPSYILTVRAEDGDQLKIQDGSLEGWVDKVDYIRISEAPAFFTKIITRDQYQNWAYFRRAIVFDQLKQYHKAIRDYSEFLSLSSENSMAYWHRAFDWYRLQDFDKAIADYERAIEFEPRNSSLYSSLCVIYHQKEDYEKAIEYCSKSIFLNPKEANSYYLRAECYYYLERYDAAVRDINKTLEIYPKNYVYFRTRGFISYAQGEIINAIADLSDAIRLNPQDVYSFRRRAYAWRKEKKYDKAIEDLTSTCQLDPIDVSSKNTLALWLATSPEDNLRDGKKSLALALDACWLTDWKEPVCLATLAAAYAEIGQFDEALKYENEALEDLNFKIEQGEQSLQRLELYERKMPRRE